MKDKRECKIVQELLPNYIENITSIEVKEYIEEHINECDECKQRLQNMQFDFDLDKVDDREIDYLKSIKIKNKRKIFIAILSVVVISIFIIIGIFWFNSNYSLYRNENGEIEIQKTNINGNKILNYEIMILKGKTIKNEYINWYVIMDVKKEECVNIIQELEGFSNEKLEEQYRGLKENWDYLCSPRIENNKLYMSIYNYNTKSKEEIKQIFENKYEIISIINL